MMKKRLIALFLSLAMMLSLAACGEQPTNSGSESASSGAEETVPERQRPLHPGERAQVLGGGALLPLRRRRKPLPERPGRRQLERPLGQAPGLLLLRILLQLPPREAPAAGERYAPAGAELSADRNPDTIHIHNHPHPHKGTKRRKILCVPVTCCLPSTSPAP